MQWEKVCKIHVATITHLLRETGRKQLLLSMTAKTPRVQKLQVGGTDGENSLCFPQPPNIVQ